MATMPRPRLPHLQRETTRHGSTVWYVRLAHGGKRTRLRAAFGSTEFEAEYHAALQGHAPAATASRKMAAGTLEWAAGLYQKSSAWTALGTATRGDRGAILRRILKESGDKNLAAITRAHVIRGRDRRAATPAAARHFLATLRGLFKWAIDAELVKVDPTEGIKPPVVKSDGFAVWTDEDIGAFRGRWPLGTRERVAFEVILGTGLRRGDAANVGRPHVRDGVIRITTEKTGERVAIPMSAEMIDAIEAGPCGEMTFIATAARKRMTKESFGNWFRNACRMAGVEKSAHGIRKAAATQKAGDGFSESELNARFGWRGSRMASHYTKSANREQLSIRADERAKARTSIPAPAQNGKGYAGK